MLAFPSWSDNLNSEFDFGSTPVDILLDWLLFLQKNMGYLERKSRNNLEYNLFVISNNILRE